MIGVVVCGGVARNCCQQSGTGIDVFGAESRIASASVFRNQFVAGIYVPRGGGARDLLDALWAEVCVSRACAVDSGEPVGGVKRVNVGRIARHVAGIIVGVSSVGNAVGCRINSERRLTDGESGVTTGVCVLR